MYGERSKISNTSCLSNRPRLTVHTQIRLLLKKQSDQDISCLLLRQVFCETNILFENRNRRKSVWNIRAFTVFLIIFLHSAVGNATCSGNVY